MPKKRRRRGYHKGQFSSKKTLRTHSYRSGWEEKYMVFLDDSPAVKDWDYESLVIEYVSNIRSGKTRKYHPDFLVTYNDGRVEVVEIKPSKKLSQRLIQKKISAAQEWCGARGFSFRIITENELKELGLL
jgi:hypothetical protein